MILNKSVAMWFANDFQLAGTNWTKIRTEKEFKFRSQ